MFCVNTAAGGGKITQTLGLIGWSSCNPTIIPTLLGSLNLTVTKTPCCGFSSDIWSYALQTFRCHKNRNCQLIDTQTEVISGSGLVSRVNVVMWLCDVRLLVSAACFRITVRAIMFHFHCACVHLSYVNFNLWDPPQQLFSLSSVFAFTCICSIIEETLQLFY